MSASKSIIGGLRFVVPFLIVCVVSALWLVPEPDVSVEENYDSEPVSWAVPSLPDLSAIDKSYKVIVSWQKKNEIDIKVGHSTKWDFRGVVRVDDTLWALVEENGELQRLQKGDSLPGGEALHAISENQLEVMDDGDMVTVVLY
jgi:hypothetical protein